MSRIVLPGFIRQFAYVVAPDELDAAVAAWTARGVGPWYFMSEIRPNQF
jgi:hypothetical protein